MLGQLLARFPEERHDAAGIGDGADDQRGEIGHAGKIKRQIDFLAFRQLRIASAGHPLGAADQRGCGETR